MSETIEEMPSGDTVDIEELSEDSVDTESNADPDPAPEDRSPEPLHLDQVFGILKNQRRRYVLQYLKESDGEASLSEISEQIAAWENDKDVKQISSSERKRVYVGLYQCHLPKMDGMGIVAFNKPRGLIEPTDDLDYLYKYLDNADRLDGSLWSGHSMALSVAASTLLGLALLLGSITAAPVIEATIVSLMIVFLTYSIVGFVRKRTNESNDAPIDGY